MRINVNWCNFEQNGSDMSLLTIEPIPVFKFYPEVASADFRKCPAHQNHLKNTYVVCSPIDMEVKINKEEKWADVSFPKTLPKDMFAPRFGEEKESPYPIFSIGICRFVFTSDSGKDVFLSQLEPTLEWDRDRDTRVIEGTFNISRWTRPIDAAFEQRNKVTTFSLKRGQPMFYIKLFTDNPEDVIVLNRIEMTPELQKDVERCIKVKTYMPNKKLQFLYDMRDSFIHSFRKVQEK